ncbi:MAG: hypothetical protein JW814_01980 [Candidatus Krumholzibacteriota bacterium]|nr:hypothetical protein [Candidatus Krumholzibacteriota bacterium]
MKHKIRIKTIIFPLVFTSALSAAVPLLVSGARPLPFLEYSIEMKDPRLDLITVTGTMRGLLGEETRLKISPDNGGGKLDPIGFAACGTDRSPMEAKREGDIWIIGSGGKELTFSYDVVLTVEDRYLPEIRGMMTLVDSERSRITGRDIFLVPADEVSGGIIIDIGLFPDRELRATCLSNGNRLIVPEASSLDVMLAVSGEYRYSEARIADTDLVLAIAGEWAFDDGEFFDVVKNIVGREIDMFGSSPRKKYLFVCDRNPVRGSKGYDFYGVHYGGGMLLLFDSKIDRSQLYGTPMAIISHEFFHNWNGEFLAPASDSFSWFTEGATVFYSYQVLLQERIISEEQYLEKRRVIEQRYFDNPELACVPIGDACNSDLSDKDMVNMLYDGGFLAAEAIDGWILEKSGGKYHLIDIMRSIYQKNPGGVVIDEEYLCLSIGEVVGSDISPFIRELIHTSATAILASS